MPLEPAVLEAFGLQRLTAPLWKVLIYTDRHAKAQGCAVFCFVFYPLGPLKTSLVCFINGKMVGLIYFRLFCNPLQGHKVTFNLPTNPSRYLIRRLVPQ